MSKKDEALKLALEALKQIDEAMPFPVAKFAQAVIREVLAEQPAQQPAQQPICGLDVYLDPNDGLKPKLFPKKPAQPSKPWVGLTDEQIKLIMDGRGEEGDDDYVKPAFDPFGISEDDLMNFARAIEAAHGIKGDA